MTHAEALDEAFRRLPVMVRRRLARKWRLEGEGEPSKEQIELACNCTTKTLQRDKRLFEAALIGVYLDEGFTDRNISVTLGISLATVEEIHVRIGRVRVHTARQAA